MSPINLPQPSISWFQNWNQEKTLAENGVMDGSESTGSRRSFDPDHRTDDRVKQKIEVSCRYYSPSELTW